MDARVVRVSVNQDDICALFFVCFCCDVGFFCNGCGV